MYFKKTLAFFVVGALSLALLVGCINRPENENTKVVENVEVNDENEKKGSDRILESDAEEDIIEEINEVVEDYSADGKLEDVFEEKQIIYDDGKEISFADAINIAMKYLPKGIVKGKITENITKGIQDRYYALGDKTYLVKLAYLPLRDKEYDRNKIVAIDVAEVIH